MRFSAALLLLFCAPLLSQESFKVYTEHPRLLLTARRLKLLRRERERQSMRWNQFGALVAGRAPMPEQGFASALFHQVSDDKQTAKDAIAWALGPGADLRQAALVYDWCQDVLSESQSRALSARLRKGIEESRNNSSIPAVRSRLMAAVALGDRDAAIAEIVQSWWRGRIAPALKAGQDAVPRDDIYPLYEILHVLRDNLNIDLRENAPEFFKVVPIYHLVSYYPATYPAPEGEYRIPPGKAAGDPDLRQAALSRAADLIMVAYDTNASESQILQGWLMHDNFILRTPFGSPYEFLWANPYQPGLSYYLAPLVYHDEHSGKLFIRSSWDESASWLGFFDGQLQLFQDGKVTVLNPELNTGPIALDQALVYFGRGTEKFQAMLQEGEEIFVLGLEPWRTYAIEVDDQELTEGRADAGGILSIDVPRGIKVGVRIRPGQAKPPASPAVSMPSARGLRLPCSRRLRRRTEPGRLSSAFPLR